MGRDEVPLAFLQGFAVDGATNNSASVDRSWLASTSVDSCPGLVGTVLLLRPSVPPGGALLPMREDAASQPFPFCDGPGSSASLADVSSGRGGSSFRYPHGPAMLPILEMFTPLGNVPFVFFWPVSTLCFIQLCLPLLVSIVFSPCHPRPSVLVPSHSRRWLLDRQSNIPPISSHTTTRRHPPGAGTWSNTGKDG